MLYSRTPIGNKLLFAQVVYLSTLLDGNFLSHVVNFGNFMAGIFFGRKRFERIPLITYQMAWVTLLTMLRINYDSLRAFRPLLTCKLFSMRHKEYLKAALFSPERNLTKQLHLRILCENSHRHKCHLLALDPQIVLFL